MRLFYHVIVGNDFPRLFWRLGIINQIEMFISDHSFVSQLLKVDNTIPVTTPKKDNRDFLHPTRLPQAERVEKLVERAESARKDY